MCDAFERIASLANSLSHAELRGLLELAVRAERTGGIETSASSRHLAQSTGLARASVQTAIDSLNSRQLIRSDAGSPVQPAVHRLLCLPTQTSTGGLATEPEVAQSVSHPSLMTEPQVAQPMSHGDLVARPGVAQPESRRGLIVEPGMAHPVGHPGLTSKPPRDEKSITYAENSKERASVRTDSIDSDFDFDFERTIDRLQKAKKVDFDESTFELARKQIASHHAKYAREENRLPGLPDDTITAQFLAVAEWPRLEAMLCDLSSERKEAGYSYGWYVTVALQRIHGLAPARVREMRGRLKQSADAPGKRSAVIHQTRPTAICSNDSPQRNRSA